MQFPPADTPPRDNQLKRTAFRRLEVKAVSGKVRVGDSWTQFVEQRFKKFVKRVVEFLIRALFYISEPHNFPLLFAESLPLDNDAPQRLPLNMTTTFNIVAAKRSSSGVILIL